MTTTEVLKRLRRAIAEVDQAASDLTDPELLDHLSDAVRILKLRKVGDFDDFVVGSDQSQQSTYGINPAPDDEQGEMMVLQAAYNILDSEFRHKVLRGELGVSWQSGLEQESTISAANHYRQAVDRILSLLEALILIKKAPTSATRPQ